MFKYIDALFEVRDVGKAYPSVAIRQLKGIPLRSDSEELTKLPPFLFKPTMLMVASSESTQVFSTTTQDILNGVSSTISDNDICVGWNLDRVIVPILAANAFIEKVRLPSKFMRKLDDKWTKPIGVSIERALWQGWYSSGDKSEVTAPTLNAAMELVGLDPMKDIGSQQELLMARITAINSLHSRYYAIT